VRRHAPTRAEAVARAVATALAAATLLVTAACSDDEPAAAEPAATTAATVATTGAPTTTTTSAVEDLALCDAAARQAGIAEAASSARVTSAGDVTTIADRLAGRTFAPWDALPADHVVLQCTFTGQEAFTASTLCENGEVLAVESHQLLVDREGRWTEDPFALVAADPCAGNR
jgi:hypothetical protein